MDRVSQKGSATFGKTISNTVECNYFYAHVHLQELPACFMVHKNIHEKDVSCYKL